MKAKIVLLEPDTLEKGMTAYWKDPDAENTATTSGLFQIMTVNVDEGEDITNDTCILISNGTTELECFADELFILHAQVKTKVKICGGLFSVDKYSHYLINYKQVSRICSNNLIGKKVDIELINEKATIVNQWEEI